MLVEHDEYPITQDWEQKVGVRVLQFWCGGSNFDTLADAIRHQARLEGTPRPDAPKPKPKKKRR